MNFFYEKSSLNLPDEQIVFQNSNGWAKVKSEKAKVGVFKHLMKYING